MILLTKLFTTPNLVINSTLRCPREIALFRMVTMGTLVIGSEHWVERQAARLQGFAIEPPGLMPRFDLAVEFFQRHPSKVMELEGQQIARYLIYSFTQLPCLFHSHLLPVFIPTIADHFPSILLFKPAEINAKQAAEESTVEDLCGMAAWLDSLFLGDNIDITLNYLMSGWCLLRLIEIAKKNAFSECPVLCNVYLNYPPK